MTLKGSRSLNRVQVAHRGRIAPTDRARNRSRPRPPARRATPPTRRTRREIAAVEPASSPCWTRPGSATATNSSLRPRGTALGLPRGRRELPAPRPCRARDDRDLGWIEGRTAGRVRRKPLRDRPLGPGPSFQSFYDFLLSESRQAELADLLAEVRPSTRSKQTIGSVASTTTGPRLPIGRNAPSGRYRNNCVASSTTRSGWRIGASWTWFGR